MTFWILVFSGTLVILGFVSSNQKSMACSELKVNIDYSGGMYFLRTEDVESVLKEKGMYPPGRTMAELKLKEIEAVIREIPEVKNVEVYKTVDGIIGINIRQKTPIVRVINMHGESFYLDEQGYQMPVTGRYFPRVLVANGYVNELAGSISATQIAEDEEMSGISLSDDIYYMASFIRKNSFWDAQIQEMYFNKQGEVELVPVVGQHRILFGPATDIEEKFNKLMKFYKVGLRKAGWNKYDTINLKFKKQVVCTKRE